MIVDGGNRGIIYVYIYKQSFVGLWTNAADFWAWVKLLLLRFLRRC